MIELSRHGNVAVLTLAKPPVNAMDGEMVEAIHGALDQLETFTDDGGCAVLHLRSRQKVFAAGADLAFLGELSHRPDLERKLSDYVDRIQGVFARIENLPQVTIAEIGGAALGAGLELALSCDLRIAAAEAKMGLPEVSVGLLPAAGGTQRLTRLCGRGTAAMLILAAEPVDGETARQLGLAQAVFPKAGLEAGCAALVTRIASLPPAALQAAKRCIAAAEKAGVNGYAMERDAACSLLAMERTQTLIASFLSRSK